MGSDRIAQRMMMMKGRRLRALWTCQITLLLVSSGTVHSGHGARVTHVGPRLIGRVVE